MGVISLDLQQTDAGYDVKKEIERLDQEIDDEVAARVAADTSIWEEIEAIEAASDVVDVVGTYEALENYDTSKLQDNDLIKVLQDETRDDAITYYRWNKTSSAFAYVGSEGPYYTASETDTLLAAKQDTLIAGDNITIAADGKTISATDTTYTHFTGATASADGTAGLVPAPIAGDEDKVLKGDGTWGTASPNYTAGTGIDITNDVISVDTTVVATQTDLSGKQDALTAGTNVQINGNTISATDTTYSNFVGTDGTDPGVAGLVPAPAVTDDDKYLKSDGTWAAVQSGATVTTFYIGGAPGVFATDTIYKESTLTTVAREGDLLAALESGGVRICQMANGAVRYTYDVISYSVLLGVYTIVHYSLGTTVYAFGFDTATTIDWSTNEVQTKLAAGSNITISGSTISARDTTYSAFGGATSQVAGTSGLVPAPAIGDDTKYLKGDGTWGTIQSGNMTVTDYFFSGDLENTTIGSGVDIYVDEGLTTRVTWSDFYDSVKTSQVRLIQNGNGIYSTYYVYFDFDNDADYEYAPDSPYYVVVNKTKEKVFVLDWSLSSDVAPLLDAKKEFQEKLAAGTNITIAADGKTISATDTTYTAGTGIAISAQNVISASPNNISSNDWSGLWQ